MQDFRLLRVKFAVRRDGKIFDALSEKLSGRENFFFVKSKKISKKSGKTGDKLTVKSKK